MTATFNGLREDETASNLSTKPRFRIRVTGVS